MLRAVATKENFSKAFVWAKTPDVLYGILLSSFFINILALAFPLVLLQVYDRIIPNHSISTLVLLITIVGVALILESVLRILRSIVISWIEARYEYKLGNMAFSHLLRTRLSDYEKEGAGAHIDKLNSFISLKDVYSGQVVSFLLDLPFVALYILVIAYFSKVVAIVPIVMILLIVVIMNTIGANVKQIMQQHKQHSVRKSNFVIEVLSGIHSVKSQAMESLMMRRYERIQTLSTYWERHLVILTSYSLTASSVISQITVVCVVIAGSVQVIHQNMTVGGLAACTLLASRCTQPIAQLMIYWRKLQSLPLAKKSFEEICSLSCDHVERKSNDYSIDGDIEFKNVSYDSESDSSVLSNINFKIEKNKTIAISDDGIIDKNILFSLIMGISSPKSGEVLINNIKANEIGQGKLRESVAYLPSSSKLFDGTILENLTYFRGAKYIDKAKALANRIGVDEYILSLPDGYQTRVGNRLIETLNPSLFQGIIIIRELLDNPSIILYDIASSDIEIAIQHKLLEMLKNMKKNCTIVLSTNDKKFLSMADRRYFLADGCLKELSDG